MPIYHQCPNRFKVVCLHPGEHCAPEPHGRGQLWKLLEQRDFFEFLSQNDNLYQRKISILGRIEHQQKICSIRKPSRHLILPPFPLKRRCRELTLPEFMASAKGNKVQEVNEKGTKGFSRGPAHLTYTSDINSPVNSAPTG